MHSYRLQTGQAPVLLTQIQDEAADDERRRKRQEIEEKKRRIAESQKKANVQRRRDVSESEKKKEEAAAELGTTDIIEDLSEKRRSLLMMWESYADGEGPGPENHELQEKSEREQFGYDVMMMETAHGDVSYDNKCNIELVNVGTLDWKVDCSFRTLR
jgi:hydroxylamine reductase (hybrid-cluster protein)